MADTPDAAAVQAAIERLRKINHADLTMRLIEGQSYKQACCWYVDEVKAVVESLADACEHYQRELAAVTEERDLARMMKPNEYEHIRASERSAHVDKHEAQKQLAAALARERGLREALEQYARIDYYHFLLDPIGQQTDPTAKARAALAEPKP